MSLQREKVCCRVRFDYSLISLDFPPVFRCYADDKSKQIFNSIIPESFLALTLWPKNPRALATAMFWYFECPCKEKKFVVGFALITLLYRLTSCRYSVVMQMTNQNKYLIPLSQSLSWRSTSGQKAEGFGCEIIKPWRFKIGEVGKPIIHTLIGFAGNVWELIRILGTNSYVHECK